MREKTEVTKQSVQETKVFSIGTDGKFVPMDKSNPAYDRHLLLKQQSIELEEVRGA